MAFVPAGTIAIPPGPRPGFDYGSVYQSSSGPRVFVAHTGANQIEVLDGAKKSHLRALADLSGVASSLVDQATDRLFMSQRAASKVTIFRASDEQKLGEISTGPGPNRVVYDPKRKHLFSFNVGEPQGVGCTLSVIDVVGMNELARLPIPGRPTMAVYDGATDRVYGNIREPAEIIAIDAEKFSTVASYPVPVKGPHGLGLAGNTLYCAADEGALVSLNRDTGAFLKSVKLPGAPDATTRDAARGRLLIAVGSPGVVCVVDEKSLEIMQTVVTGQGAHTLAWDETNRTLYAFVPGGPNAAVFVDP